MWWECNVVVVLDFVSFGFTSYSYSYSYSTTYHSPFFSILLCVQHATTEGSGFLGLVTFMLFFYAVMIHIHPSLFLFIY